MVNTFKIVGALVALSLFQSVMCISAASDVSQCAFKPDFVPEPIRDCATNVPISCKGSTVCYKYLDTLPTIPCIIDAYGFSGLLKMNQCGSKVKYTVKPGMEVCIEESELRKFYSCFDE